MNVWAWVIMSAYTLICATSMVVCVWTFRQISELVVILRDEELDEDETT